MRYPISRLFLALSGAIAVAIGASILLIPHIFFETNHITLGSDPNLMSEIRAPSGLLLATGVVMICGAVRETLLRKALLITAIVFSLYGFSRLVSLALDGVPSSSLIGAMIIELVVGAIAVLLITTSGASRSTQ